MLSLAACSFDATKVKDGQETKTEKDKDSKKDKKKDKDKDKDKDKEQYTTITIINNIIVRITQ